MQMQMQTQALGGFHLNYFRVPVRQVPLVSFGLFASALIEPLKLGNMNHQQ